MVFGCGFYKGRAKIRFGPVMLCSGFFWVTQENFFKKICLNKNNASIFAPLLKKSIGSVVQSVRMPPCHGGGR
ncbi:MAG TPA: hypothetical protein DCF33_06580, partial [Saprospirales bacterium]|nr:hypothetical protein [Saprospirales bacterium]